MKAPDVNLPLYAVDETPVHHAALAIEHGAELLSAVNDFARFRGLRWSNPVA